MSSQRRRSDSDGDEVNPLWGKWEQDLSDIYYLCNIVRQRILELFDARIIKAQSVTYRVMAASLEIHMKYLVDESDEALSKYSMPARMKSDQDYIYLAWQKYADLCKQGDKLYEEHLTRKGQYHILRPQVDLMRQRIESLQADLVLYESRLKEAKNAFSRDDQSARLFDPLTDDDQTGHGGSPSRPGGEGMPSVRPAISHSTQTADPGPSGKDGRPSLGESGSPDASAGEQGDRTCWLGCHTCWRMQNELSPITEAEAPVSNTDDNRASHPRSYIPSSQPFTTENASPQHLRPKTSAPPSDGEVRIPPPNERASAASARETPRHSVISSTSEEAVSPKTQRPYRSPTVITINSEDDSPTPAGKVRRHTLISLSSEEEVPISPRAYGPFSPFGVDSQENSSTVPEFNFNDDGYQLPIRRRRSSAPIRLSSNGDVPMSARAYGPLSPFYNHSDDQPPTARTVNSNSGKPRPVPLDRRPPLIRLSSDDSGLLREFLSSVPAPPPAQKPTHHSTTIPKSRPTQILVEESTLTPRFDGDFATHSFLNSPKAVPKLPSNGIYQANTFYGPETTPYTTPQSHPRPQDPVKIPQPPTNTQPKPGNPGDRMLQNWGYKPGTGLGRQGNGITSPIKANGQRPGDTRAGLGFNPSGGVPGSDLETALDRLIAQGRKAKGNGNANTNNNNTRPRRSSYERVRPNRNGNAANTYPDMNGNPNKNANHSNNFHKNNNGDKGKNFNNNGNNGTNNAGGGGNARNLGKSCRNRKR